MKDLAASMGKVPGPSPYKRPGGSRRRDGAGAGLKQADTQLGRALVAVAAAAAAVLVPLSLLVPSSQG